MERAKLAIVLGLTAVATVAFSVWMLRSEAASHEEVAAPAKALVRAIEAGKPSDAPPGAEGYVRGVKEHFGRVSRARFLDAYTKRTGKGKQATTDVVSEILVRGRRGAGVLELDFDDDEITGMEELAPADVHADLDAKTEAAVKRGFERRGGKPADFLVLDGTFKRRE